MYKLAFQFQLSACRSLPYFRPAILPTQCLSIQFVYSQAGFAQDSQGRPHVDQTAKVVSALKSRNIEFNRMAARGNQDYSASTQGAEEQCTTGQTEMAEQTGPQIDDECYQPMSNVSLSGVMQSSVPHPCQNSPTHLNMPGGGIKLGDKFLSAQQHDTFRGSREFSTLIMHHRLMSAARPDEDNVTVQGVQGSDDRPVNTTRTEAPAAQGIQGDNDDQYRIFLENCSRFNIGGCEAILEEVKAGRMTLNEAFQEQERRMKIVQDTAKRG